MVALEEKVPKTLRQGDHFYCINTAYDRHWLTFDVTLRLWKVVGKTQGQSHRCLEAWIHTSANLQRS